MGRRQVWQHGPHAAPQPLARLRGLGVAGEFPRRTVVRRSGKHSWGLIPTNPGIGSPGRPSGRGPLRRGPRPRCGGPPAPHPGPPPTPWRRPPPHAQPSLAGTRALLLGGRSRPEFSLPIRGEVPEPLQRVRAVSARGRKVSPGGHRTPRSPPSREPHPDRTGGPFSDQARHLLLPEEVPGPSGSQDIQVSGEGARIPASLLRHAQGGDAGALRRS